MKPYTLLIILSSFATLALTADVSHPFASAIDPETGEIDTNEVRAIYTQSLREAKARVADKLKGQNLPPEEVDSILKKWDKRIEESESYYPITTTEKITQLKEDIPVFLQNYSAKPKVLNKELMQRMANNLRESDKIDGHMPRTGERVIQPDIALAMEPLREFIYGMVRSGDEIEESYGVRYLTYLTPTDESMNLLYSVGQSESSEAFVALDTIFKMGWDTPELRNELIKNLQLKASGELAHGGKAEVYGGEWNLEEGIPFYIEIFQTRFSKEKLIDRNSLKQLRQLNDFTDARSVLPILLSIAEQINLENYPDHFAIRDLKKTIISLGGVWPEDKAESEPVAKEVAEVIEEVTAPEPAIEEPAEVVVAAPIKEDVEQSPNWWLWLVGMVAVVGGILKVCRKK